MYARIPLHVKSVATMGLNHTSIVARGQPALQYSSDGRPSFFGSLLKNLKEEYGKSQEMQESLRKFREDAQKLEESEALKEARRKFRAVEKEAAEKGGNVFKEHVGGIAQKVKGTLDEVSRTESVRRVAEEVGKRAEDAKKAAADAAESVGKSGAFKAASEGAATIKEEIEGHSLGGKVYRPPSQLRKRKEYAHAEGEEAPIAADEESTGVELHKDSKFFASWQSFKENNPVVNKFVDYRVKYEESDNPVVRGARIVTDKVQDIFGGVFARTELSEVLTEIVKSDPNFCKEQFLKDCERDFIPNILEAMVRGDLDVLQDWCYEAPFNILAAPIKQARERGLRYMT